VAGVARFDFEIPLFIQLQIVIHRGGRANAAWRYGKITIVLVWNVQQVVGLWRAQLAPLRTLGSPAFRASAFSTAPLGSACGAASLWSAFGATSLGSAFGAALLWAAFGAASLWATASAAAPSTSTATTAAIPIVGRFASLGGRNRTRRCKLVVEVIQLTKYVVQFRRRGEQIVLVVKVTRWWRTARAGRRLGRSLLTTATTATASSPATAMATFALAAMFVTSAALARACSTIGLAIGLTLLIPVSGANSRLFVK